MTFDSRFEFPQNSTFARKPSQCAPLNRFEKYSWILFLSHLTFRQKYTRRPSSSHARKSGCTRECSERATRWSVHDKSIQNLWWHWDYPFTVMCVPNRSRLKFLLLINNWMQKCSGKLIITWIWRISSFVSYFLEPWNMKSGKFRRYTP